MSYRSIRRQSLTLMLASLATASANAANFIVLNSSTLNDVRQIGAANIPEINDYTTYGGALNPMDPTSWPLLDASIATYPYADPNDPNKPVGIELNNINVDGTLSLSGGSVTGATLNQLGRLSKGTFQTAATTSDMVAGDTSLLNNDWLSGTGQPLKSVMSNAMVWVYNPVTNQLNHQAGGGTATTSASIATCVFVTGTGPTGSCRQLAAAVDASGELGQATIGSSIWNWNGVAANYQVRDSQTTPWHAATGTSTTGGLVVSGAGGITGVTWDLNGCTETSLTCTIFARVVSDALSGANATATSALYTLQLQNTVPVPAAVWLLGSALGALGIARRRQRTS